MKNYKDNNCIRSLCSSVRGIVLTFTFFISINIANGQEIWEWHNLFYQVESLSNYKYSSWEEAVKDPLNTTRLSFKGNDIISLPDEIASLPNLMEIDFSYCKKLDIDKIITQLLPLKKLEKLNFAESNISKLPPLIGELKSLRFLNFKNCHLLEIPPQIGQLVNLEILSFNTYEFYKYGSAEYLEQTGGGNNLKALPKEIGLLTSLKILDLAFNNLTELPSEIGNLKNLQILNLKGNELIKLPIEFGQCNHLEKLDLCGNKLQLLPQSFQNLDSLRELRMESCNLTNELNYKQVISVCSHLKNLEKLNLSFCNIKEIPIEIGDFRNLKELKLYGNIFTSLPKEIGKLKTLKKLELNQGALSVLPPEIGDLENLEELYLHHNNLRSIPIEIGNLTKLWTLVLCGNPLNPKALENIRNILTNTEIKFNDDCR